MVMRIINHIMTELTNFDFKKAVEAEKKKYLENIKAKKERYI